jgi:hypothetical protein
LTILKSSSLLHKKASKDSLKEGGTERLDIIRRIAELQAQIKQVEKDVHHPEKEILQTGKACLWNMVSVIQKIETGTDFQWSLLEKAKSHSHFKRFLCVFTESHVFLL